MRCQMLALDVSEAYTLSRVLIAVGIHSRAIQQGSHDLPHPTRVVPFGNYGAGLWTGHPIGLVIVIGLLFMGFVGLPEARWFLALAVPAGAVCGLFMWFRHRKGLAGS
jgi:hypothetical protein